MVSVTTESNLSPSLSEPRSAGKRDRAASHESFAALVDASSNAGRSDPRGGFDPAVPSRRMLERDVVRDSQPVSASSAADRSRAPQRSDAPRADAADRRSGNDGRDSKADAPAASDDKPSRDAATTDKAASDSDGAGTTKADDSASQDAGTPASQEAAAEAAKADSQAVIQTAVEAVPVVAATVPTTTTTAAAATTPAGETVSAAAALAALQAQAQQGEPQPALNADAAADQAATPAPHLAAMVAQATAAKTAIKTAAADKAAASDGAEQANAATEEAKPEASSAAAGGATVLTDGAKGGEHKAEHKAAHHAAQNEAAAQGTAQADGPVVPRHHADANAAATANQLSATPDQVLTPAPQQLQPSSQLAANGMPTTQWTANVATNAAVPMNRLAIEIAATAQAGNSRFEIRLDPAELGRIDVRIEVDRHGNVTSHLTVEKPETLTMLRNDAPQLQRALDDAGLKTSDSGLQFSLRDQSSGQNQNSDDQQPRYHRLEIGEEEVPPAAVIGRNYGRMLGAAGGVDIRV